MLSMGDDGKDKPSSASGYVAAIALEITCCGRSRSVDQSRKDLAPSTRGIHLHDPQPGWA
jgi:hypothetical protein